MRKVPSILLLSVSGFFFYTVGVLTFVKAPSIALKIWILIWFIVPALALLVGGLGLSGFRSWMRDTGIVLLAAAGFAACVAFTVACFLMSAQFRQMIPPNTLKMFSDYASGGGFTVGLAIAGWLLLRANKRSADAAPPTGESPTPQRD